MNGKICAYPALVMARVPMTIGNRCRNAGDCTVRTAPEGKCIFAGSHRADMGGTGPAGAECPAKAGITGTEKLSCGVHATV